MVADNAPLAERKYYSRATVAKARTLYVVKGLFRQEIAEKLEVEPSTLSKWIHAGNWVAERERRIGKEEEKALAHAQDEHAAFLGSISSQVEELTEDSLSVAREAVESGLSGTRELQQASQSAKNFLEMYMRANKLDRGSADVNIRAEIVLRLPGEDQPIDVTPVENDSKNMAIEGGNA